MLVHGIESDWIEDEMADDDEDFTNIVLEQKVKTAFSKASWAKKLNFVTVERWGEGPLHRSQPPVVVTFKSWWEDYKSGLNTLVYWQEGEKDVIKPTSSRVAEDWDRPHRGLKVLSFIALSNNGHLLCVTDDSRWKQIIKIRILAFFHFII